jgi:hypothetical protein
MCGALAKCRLQAVAGRGKDSPAFVCFFFVLECEVHAKQVYTPGLETIEWQRTNLFQENLHFWIELPIVTAFNPPSLVEHAFSGGRSWRLSRLQTAFPKGY